MANPCRGASRTQVAAIPERQAPVERPRPVAPAVPVSQMPSSSGMFVQAGAFTSYANAQRRATELSPLGTARISEAIVGNATFYRVRLGPYADPNAASRVLSEVLAAGYGDARLVQN